MRQLSIFVSSTCYDLKSLREHLRSEISSWGHDPILSEYESFPVCPQLTTVENCKKVVRERTDVFVLIVGGKRGSLDPKTQNSVVNSEYREARAAGIDCIVFVERQVWDLRTLHEKNPTADFSPMVDNPAVFSFLNELGKDTNWIFPFLKTEDILSALRIQLSTRLRELLLRSRENRLLIPSEFGSEHHEISALVVEKGKFWEYRLSSAILRDRIERLDAKYAELESGFVVRRTQFLAGRDTINYIQDLLRDLSICVETIGRILAEQLTPAFGPPGIAGNAIEIKKSCDNLYSIFLSLYEWELDVRFVRPHQAFEVLFSTMRGWTIELLSELHRIPTEFDSLLLNPDLCGEHKISLTIEAPKGLESFVAQLNHMCTDQNVLAALAEGR